MAASNSGYHFPKMLSVALCFILSFTGCLSIVYYYVEAREADDGKYLASVAANRAKKYLNDEKVIERKSFGKKMKLSVLRGFPGIVILSMLMGYVLIGLLLYDAFPSSGWKVFVSLFALGVKVVGNKALLVVVEKAKVRQWWRAGANRQQGKTGVKRQQKRQQH